MWLSSKSMIRFFIPLTLLFQAAQAGDLFTFTSGDGRATTIELFTSEGCSSCPPADAWLSRLKSDPRLWKRIVPMAFHVDYWDYIGWRDRFASPENSARQKTHRTQGNIRSVYTPGFVVDGREWRGWFRRGVLDLPESAAKELRVDLDGAKITAGYGAATAEPLILNVALLGFDLSNQVSSGENSGRLLSHDFVVLQQKSMLSENGSWRLELPSIENSPVKTKGLAAWVTHPDSLKPLQATGGWLTN
ncbi:MAG: DUF1223 domain-containing protein [Gammaproteobacteria bacterium]|mgnify:CR=1 FL=1|nr:DUF1223 domain-containing protein [Gammaproteobacteria bacterium]HXK56426.1 DUF1223 domain-containing protein [Gammaproteobacteria bacterium]